MNEKNTAIICIDLQEKLVNMLSENEKIKIENNAAKLLKTASILNLPTIITEQYPKGLGSTIDKIKEITDFEIIEKTTFSALQTDDFINAFNKIKSKNIVVFGIETHICVYQTVIDLLEKNYTVYVVKDVCGSRNQDNYDTALELLKQKGAYIATLEIILFNLLKSSKHPNFKEIQALIK